MIVCILIVSGCTSRLTDFTIISTKNVDMSDSGNFTKGTERVEGIDKRHVIVFIPTGSPDLKEAIDDAIEKTPNCVALLDGVVYSKFWYIPYIYGQFWYQVEGTPLISTPSTSKK